MMLEITFFWNKDGVTEMMLNCTGAERDFLDDAQDSFAPGAHNVLTAPLDIDCPCAVRAGHFNVLELKESLPVTDLIFFDREVINFLTVRTPYLSPTVSSGKFRIAIPAYHVALSQLFNIRIAHRNHRRIQFRLLGFLYSFYFLNSKK